MEKSHLLPLMVFGISIGVVFFLTFRKGKIPKMKLFALAALALFPLILNSFLFFAFDAIIKPLIPPDACDGHYGWWAGLLAGSFLMSFVAIAAIIGSMAGLMKSERFRKIVDDAPLPKAPDLREDGKGVYLTCPTCNHNLPLKWIFFSGYKTSHGCTHCVEYSVS